MTGPESRKSSVDRIRVSTQMCPVIIFAEASEDA